ncbi:CTP synthase, partial [Lactobacillus sp. XV13L]|nr:CTP synthase [Lactobacillus sp. XV13L]
IIDLMPDQKHVENRGGTLRLGAYPCKLKPGTVAAAAYNNQSVIQERHRHRYEFNNEFRDLLGQHGLVFSGVSPDNRLVEVVEYPQNRLFVGVQYHPEFLSRPNRPEPIYKQFIGAACGLNVSAI